MKKEFKVKFYLRSGNIVFSPIVSENIEEANHAIERQISERSIITAINSEEKIVSIVTASIEYFEIRIKEIESRWKI